MSIYSHDFRKVFLWILISHALLTALAYFGLPEFQFKKRPDLTIELSVLAPSVGGPQTPITQARSVTKPEMPAKTLPKDNDGTQVSKSIDANTATTSSFSSGPANIQTADADYKAAYLKNPKPPYPPIAVKMRLEGKVTILAEVLSDGRAGRVALETSSGHEMLDQSALETVKKWQFSPARKDGVIINQVVRIPITFNLKSR